MKNGFPPGLEVVLVFAIWFLLLLLTWFVLDIEDGFRLKKKVPFKISVINKAEWAARLAQLGMGRSCRHGHVTEQNEK